MSGAAHVPALRAPRFRGLGAASVGGATPLRFLDDDFVRRFRADLRAGAYENQEAFAWRTEDARGSVSPALRRAVHRAYYLVVSEATCDVAGDPAFDPRKIVSAGFVVRRLALRAAGAGKEPDAAERKRTPAPAGEAWREIDGVPTGWSETQLEAPPAPDETVHPLHVAAERGVDGRPRTYLYGYLPLGGSASSRPAAEDPAAATTELDREFPAGAGDTPLLDARGRETRAFVVLCAVALRRFRVGVEAIGTSPAPQFAAALRAIRTADGRDDAFAALRRKCAPLRPDSGSAARDVDALLSSFDKALAGAPTDGAVNEPAGPFRARRAGDRTPRLVATADEVAALRAAAAASVARLAAEVTDHPVPRYAEDDAVAYAVVPFVRYREGRCERVAVGEPSLPFRVARTCDPTVGRAVPIPLPKISDLRALGGKAAARFVADPELASRLNPALPPPFKLPFPSMTGDVQWVIVFGLPAITLCALILLAVMLSLLNLVFYWLPYALQVVPVLKSKKVV